MSRRLGIFICGENMTPPPSKHHNFFFFFVQYLHSLILIVKKAFQAIYQGVGNVYIFSKTAGGIVDSKIEYDLF